MWYSFLAMMRIVTIVAAVTAAGCGNEAAKPTATSLEGKSPEQQCELLAPRLRPCGNELVVAQAVAAGIDAEVASAIGEQLEAADRKPAAKTGRDETIGMCMTSIAADPDYAQRVLQCWDEKTCESFVACAKP